MLKKERIDYGSEILDSIDEDDERSPLPLKDDEDRTRRTRKATKKLDGDNDCVTILLNSYGSDEESDEMPRGVSFVAYSNLWRSWFGRRFLSFSVKDYKDRHTAKELAIICRQEAEKQGRLPTREKVLELHQSRKENHQVHLLLNFNNYFFLYYCRFNTMTL